MKKCKLGFVLEVGDEGAVAAEHVFDGTHVPERQAEDAKTKLTKKNGQRNQR